MNMRTVRSFGLIVFGISMALTGDALVLYYETKNSSVGENEGLVERHEFADLAIRARVSNQPYLESILHTINGSMAEGTLNELINYTAAYSEHAIKEHPHRKIEIIQPEKHKRTRI